MNAIRKPEKAILTAPTYSPAKDANPKPSPRVQNLDFKLLNMFDKYEKQRTLIKDINELVSDTKPLDPKLTSPASRPLSSRQQVQFFRTTQTPSRSSVSEKAEINIGTLTERFGQYRSSSKKLTTDEDLTNNTESQAPEQTRPVSTNPMRNLAANQIPDIKIQPFTARGNKRPSMMQELFEDSRNRRLKTPALTARDDRGTSLENLKTASGAVYMAPLTKNRSEHGRVTVSANVSKNELSLERAPSTEGPQIKFSAFRKTLKTQEGSRKSLKAEDVKMFNFNVTKKKLEIDDAPQEEVNLFPKSARGDIPATRNEFRIKTAVPTVTSSLRPNKVTTEQKDRLTKFLNNEFVDEVISNKHTIKDFYDGEAVSNLNELKKIMTSHATVRNTIYEKASQQRRQANAGTTASINNIQEEFPADMPRLKKFELSEPEGNMMGLRPKCFLGKRSSQDTIRNEDVKVSQDESIVVEEPDYIQELNNNRASLATLNKAVHFQKDKCKKLRLALRNKLLKYAALGIYLQDLKNGADIFPTKPYQREGSYQFMRAVKAGDYRTVVDLLQKDKHYVFEFDPIKQTALHWASKRGHIKILTALIDCGADTDAADLGGKTPLYYALKEKNGDVVGRLLFSKASPWSPKNTDYKVLCEDARCLKYLNKARQLAILLMFHCAQDRAAVWEKEAKALIAPIDDPTPTLKNQKDKKADILRKL